MWIHVHFTYHSFVDDEEGITSSSLTDNVFSLRIVVLQRERERGKRSIKQLSTYKQEIMQPLTSCRMSAILLSSLSLRHLSSGTLCNIERKDHPFVQPLPPSFLYKYYTALQGGWTISHRLVLPRSSQPLTQLLHS